MDYIGIFFINGYFGFLIMFGLNRIFEIYCYFIGLMFIDDLRINVLRGKGLFVRKY